MRSVNERMGIRDRRPIFYILTLLFLISFSAMAYRGTSLIFILFASFCYLSIFPIGVFLHNTAIFSPIFVPEKGVGKAVALTFDDGPNPLNTPKIAEILREKGVRATFFCIGKNVRSYPRIVEDLHSDGHQIGNHTDTHPFLINFYSTKALAREIVSCQKTIRSTVGITPRYFRQVCGMVNINLGLLVEKLDLILVGWQVRSRDLKVNKPEEIINRIQRRVRPGAIILFHDGGEPNPRVNHSLIKALPEVIDILRERGYSFLTVEELHLLHRRYHSCTEKVP